MLRAFIEMCAALILITLVYVLVANKLILDGCRTRSPIEFKQDDVELLEDQCLPAYQLGLETTNARNARLRTANTVEVVPIASSPIKQPVLRHCEPSTSRAIYEPPPSTGHGTKYAIYEPAPDFSKRK